MTYEDFIELEKKYKGSENKDVLDLIHHIKGLHELLGNHIRTFEDIFIKAGETFGYGQGEDVQTTDSRHTRSFPIYG